MTTDLQSALLLRMEASLAKFERQIDKGVAKGRSGAKTIQRDFDAMHGRMAKSARQSAGVISRALERNEADYLSLKASMDPAEAAAQRLAAAEKVLNTALSSGHITKAQHTADMALLKRQYDSTTTAIQSGTLKAAGGIAGFTNISKGARFVLQSTAAQFADIGVQAEMGVDPLRILAQQGTQVAGSFAALGGPMGLLIPIFGTLIALGAPLIAMLMRMGDESDETEDKIKTFADALEAAETAIENANAAAARASQGGAEDLERLYGNVTEKVRELALALAEIELRAAKLNMDQLLDFTLDDKYQDQMENMFGTVGAALAGAGSEHAREQIALLKEEIAGLNSEILAIGSHGGSVPTALTDQLAEMENELAALEGRVGDIGDLANEIGVSPQVLQSYSDLEERLDVAREAADFTEIADVLSEMRQILESAGDAIDQEVKDNLAQAESEARKMAKATNEVADATRDVAAVSDTINFEEGRRGAAAMADEVLRAVRAMYELQSAGAGELRRAQLRYEHRNNPVALAGALAGDRFDRDTKALREAGFENAGEEAYYKQQRDQAIAAAQEIARLQDLTRTSSGGSGGGKGSSASEWLQTAETELQTMQRRIELIGKSKAETAALTLKYKLLDEAKSKNIDLDRTSQKTGKSLRQTIDEKADALERLAKQYEQTNERAEFFDGIQTDIKEGLLDAIVEGESFADTLDEVGKAFKRAAWEALLFNEGANATQGGGSGLLGGIIGALFGGSSSGSGSSSGTDAAQVAQPVSMEAAVAAQTPAISAALFAKTVPANAMQTVQTVQATEAPKVTLRIDEGIIVEKAQGVAIEVTQQGVAEYDRSVLPDRVQQITTDPRVRS